MFHLFQFLQKNTICAYLADPDAFERKAATLKLSPKQYFQFEKIRITGEQVHIYSIEVGVILIFQWRRLMFD